MKLRMLKTTQGSEDGFTIKTFECGKEYSVVENLGTVFIDMGVAEIVPESKATFPSSNKAEEVPSNKAEKEEPVKEERKDKAKKK